MATRIVLFNNATDKFEFFSEDGTHHSDEARTVDLELTPAQTGVTIQSAVATDQHIYAYDRITRKVYVWNHRWQRQSSLDFTPNSSSAPYRGMTATDTHLLMFNGTDNRLEYYRINNNGSVTYQSNLAREVLGATVQGLARQGNVLYLLDDQNDRVLRRNLNGTTASGLGDWVLPPGIYRSIVATDTHIIGVTREGDGRRRTLSDGVAAPTIDFVGSDWFAAFPLTIPDATVPAAPTGLAVTTARQTSLVIGWTAGATGGSPITDWEYRIIAGKTPGGTWTSTGSTATSFTIPNLTGNTEYTIEVRARNTIGVGTAASLTTTTAPTVPAAPTGLAATATHNSLALSWTPGDDGGSPITDWEYRINEGTTAGGTWTSTGSTDASVAISGLTPSTSYVVQVRGRNSVGRSTGAQLTTQTEAPDPPEAPTGTSVVAGQTSVVVSWTPGATESPITGWEYRVDNGSWTSTGSTGTSVTITGLMPNTQYEIDIRGISDGGNGASAAVTAMTTMPPPPSANVPGMPRSVAVTVNADRTVTLTFAAPLSDGGAAVSGYRIAQTGQATATYTPTGTSFTTPELVPGQYAFSVAAVNIVGAGAAAAAVTARVTARATVAITFAKALLHPGESTIARVTFSESVTEFTESDVGLSVGTKGTFSGAGTGYEVQVTAPATGEGTLTVSIAKDVVAEGNAAGEASIPYAPRAVLTVTAPATAEIGESVDVRIQSDRAISDFTSDLVSASVGRLSGFRRTDAQNYQVTLTLPSSGTGRATVSIARDVVPEGNRAASVAIGYAPAPLTFDVETVADKTYTIGVPTGSFTLPAATGGTGAKTYQLSGLPAGFTFDPNTRIVTVAPDAAVPETVVNYVVTDSATPTPQTARLEFRLTVTRGLPGAPTGLTVEVQPTTALLRWSPATQGAKPDGYEVAYAEGNSPGTQWIPTGSTRTRFLVRNLKRSTHYAFAVRARSEDRPGPASSPATRRTPIASPHNALFFKECVNYFDDGARVSEYGNPSNIIRAVADNNYKTFTREKDLVLNIAVGGNPTRVDAIFVKGQNIFAHSAEPSGGSGFGYSNRRMPSTVKNWEGTEVSTVVAGFQHDLYLLPSYFTATRVRMTFTGANAQITEIALLEFGLEIDANGDFLDMNQNFVDREGVIQPDPGGGLVYDSPIGADDRDKWEVDYVVKIVPGKTLLETPEEFLYWQAENRNHFFFMEPSRFPWRGFPAVFVRRQIPIRYRSDDKTGGEILSFRVAEQ